MDPYLEHPSSWPNVHSRLNIAIAIFLAPYLRPKYRVVVEKAVYDSVQIPHKIRQGYLEVRDVASSEVVTVLEVLTPANKRQGEGRNAYEKKRQKILGSATHLVEIDLLRKWQPMPILNEEIQSNYRILVSASQGRPQAEIYGFNLPDPIPPFPLPLRSGDAEPIVNLQALLNDIYDQSSYDLAIDYRRDPVPALSDEEAVWASEWLRQQGLR